MSIKNPRVGALTPAAAIGLACCAAAGLALAAARPTEWPTYGNDPGHSHYSPLDQITPGNVASLRPAWVFDAGEVGRSWATTPIVIAGVMYVTLPTGAAAIDAETGALLWKFVPTVNRGRAGRGVSYWPGDAAHGPRILYGISDRLFALDPKTGQPIAGFGENGSIDLRRGVTDDFPGATYSLSSPPAIYRNLAIVGPSTQEFGSIGPSGDPRAFDVVTGKEVWRFHTVPRGGELGAETWGPNGGENRAGPSAWGMITVDPATGTVFIPIGNPSDSYNGVDRPGDNLYSASVVALDAATGALKWHYQLTHHDIFDYDLSAAPTLIDVVQGGRTIPAVVQATKMGLLFVLDRRTGRPIYGVEERTVPASDVPGERASPTQPFPLKPAPLGRMSMSRGDITTMTPEANKACTEAWDAKQMHNSGPYTPASIKGTTVLIPGTAGGTNWGGVSTNPKLGYVFVNVTNQPIVSSMGPDGKGGYKLEGAYTRYNDPSGWPCIEPPWGVFAAVDTRTGDIAWRVPLGVADEYGERGRTSGTPNVGGSLAVGSGLVFIGATTDSRFRAFDAKSGRELWTVRMPAPATATPMTFVGRSGRQYVVIASGGGGVAGRGPQASYRQTLIAFALPRAGFPTVAMPDPAVPAGTPANSAATRERASAANPPRFDAPGRPAAPPARAAVSVQALPGGPGRDAFVGMCGSCHGVETVTVLRNARSGWAAVIEDMRRRGAPGDDAQAASVLDYLTQHFGPTAP